MRPISSGQVCPRLDAEQLEVSLAPCLPCMDEGRMKRPLLRAPIFGREGEHRIRRAIQVVIDRITPIGVTFALKQ